MLMLLGTQSVSSIEVPGKEIQEVSHILMLPSFSDNLSCSVTQKNVQYSAGVVLSNFFISST